MMPFFKQAVYRSPDWLDAVRSIESCVECGKYGTQAAHRNEGKGTSMKTDDCLSAALCPACHHEIDNGKVLTLQQKRERMDAAIFKTLVELCRLGLVKPMKVKRPVVST